MTMYGYKPSLAQINDDLGCSCSLCCANNKPCKSSSNPNKPETLLCENVNSQVSLISYVMIFFRTALWYNCFFGIFCYLHTLDFRDRSLKLSLRPWIFRDRSMKLGFICHGFQESILEIRLHMPRISGIDP